MARVPERQVLAAKPLASKAATVSLFHLARDFQGFISAEIGFLHGCRIDDSISDATALRPNRRLASCVSSGVG